MTDIGRRLIEASDSQGSTDEKNWKGAKQIDQHMAALMSKPSPESKRRWIWELLQNARDKVTQDFPEKDARVEVDISLERIIFRHNYGFLSTKEALSLIRGESSKGIPFNIKSKEEYEEYKRSQIGQFGTGFFTSHFLSKVVILESFLRLEEEYRRLNLELDRSGSDELEHKENIEKSVDKLGKQIESGVSESDSQKIYTKFTYDIQDSLSEDRITQDILQKTIEDIKNSLPYFLCFNNGINYFEVSNLIDDQNPSVLTFHKREKISIKGIGSLDFEILEIELDSDKDKICHIIKITSENFDFTSPCKYLNDSEQRVVLQRIPTDLPGIFVALPLMGTASFKLTGIINSTKFKLPHERDSIFLGSEVAKENSHNKQIFVEIKDLILEYIDFAVDNNWEGLQWLAYSSVPSVDWLDKTWYKDEILNPIREKLRGAKIVITNSTDEDKRRISIREAHFPQAGSSELRNGIWSLACQLGKENLPRQEDIQDWVEVLDLWAQDRFYTLENLLTEIAELENVEALGNRLIQSKATPESQDKEKVAIQFLNDVLTVVKDNKQDHLLKTIAIIPNQLGIFRRPQINHGSGSYFVDDLGIEEFLKEACAIFVPGFRQYLKHKQISYRLEYFYENQAISLVKEENGKRTSSKPVMTMDSERLISSNINEKLKLQVNDNDTESKKLRMALLLASSFSFLENNDKQKYADRNNFFCIVHNFYANVSVEVTDVSDSFLQNVPTDLWTECDKFLLRSICKIIEEQESPSKLLAKLRSEVNSSLDEDTLFDQLINFYEQINKSNERQLFKEHAILPNQDSRFVKLIQDGQGKTTNLLKDVTEQDYPRLVHEDLKCFLDELTGNFKSQLLDQRVIVELDLSPKNTSSIALDIENECEEIFSRNRDGGSSSSRPRDEIYTKLYLWMVQEATANRIFRPRFYDSRYLLRTDEQNALDIKRKEDLEQENLELKRKIQELEVQTRASSTREPGIEMNGDTLGKSQEDEIILPLSKHISERSEEARKKYEQLIQQAKNGVKAYLESSKDYNCNGWRESRNGTVISGILKRDQYSDEQWYGIQLVIRPSDGEKVIIFYSDEYDALEKSSTELWVVNVHSTSDNPYQLTLGYLLKTTGANQISLKRLL
ncbi:MAG: hypothetical protein VKI82_07365 [Leptolyngbya sp.]|nr:hypothetical protein [Leptolyngbya sp.]